MESKSTVSAPGREGVLEYLDWLKRRWSVSVDGAGAFEHPPYDPRFPLPDPAGTLGVREASDPASGLSSDQATFFMARSLAIEAEHLQGRTVWEVGCGTGVLSALAGRLGARRVLATDIDPRAVELARQTGALNGVAVEAATANLFEGTPWSGPVDVILADLPQKPSPGGGLPLGQDGGPDGSRWLLPFLEEAPRRLSREGRLYVFLHSLTHPGGLQSLHARFRARLVATMWRIFDASSYSAVFDYLLQRRRDGLCRFWDLADGRFAFLALVFAARPALAATA